MLQRQDKNKLPQYLSDVIWDWHVFIFFINHFSFLYLLTLSAHKSDQV